jgi:hypothetical protein
VLSKKRRCLPEILRPALVFKGPDRARRNVFGVDSRERRGSRYRQGCSISSVSGLVDIGAMQLASNGGCLVCNMVYPCLGTASLLA